MVQNLVTDDSNHFKRLSRRDRVHDDVAMNSNKVLRIQNTVFVLSRQEMRLTKLGLARGTTWTYLASSVHNLGGIVLTVVFDDPAKGVLDCGVIAFDKVMFDKADR